MAKAGARKVREGLHAIHGDGHFGDHPHDQQNDEPGNGKGEDRGRAGLADGGRGTNK